ncbi:hypothetical protein EDD18DRAFT_329244 [Armillaria luteobubalina]|uniref:Uncharacterized protein n=1 Tax=Armillaria luteobubalina TaxID=153913 RepID=A0AA39U0K5_9AGAR|nr:hypothetical protein EDD18DRAFT_329244 [Armillaria luteobubalina]
MSISSTAIPMRTDSYDANTEASCPGDHSTRTFSHYYNSSNFLQGFGPNTWWKDLLVFTWAAYTEMAYQSSFRSTAMYLQELIDEIVDYLHDSPSALKACSLVARKFYLRTRVHLFRKADCDDPESARIFNIVHDSPALLQYIKRVQFRCLDFFLPKHQATTFEFLHSLLSPMTLSLWDDSALVIYSREECQWDHILPSFVSSAPYLAITRLEVEHPQWTDFQEFHQTVLSLPNVTELYISELSDVITNNDPVVPVPTPAPCIRKLYVEVAWDTLLGFWEGLHSYRSVYLQHLEEFHAMNTSPEELDAVFRTANSTLNGLKVLEINCIQDPCLAIFGLESFNLPSDISPLHLNPNTELRVILSLDHDMLRFIRWWVKCFKGIEKESSTVMERLTIDFMGHVSTITPEQLEPLKRAFEELSDLLSKLFRNVDLVFQVMNYPVHWGLCTGCLEGAIIDACDALKEKEMLRVFEMKYTPGVPAFPFPPGTRRIF